MNWKDILKQYTPAGSYRFGRQIARTPLDTAETNEDGSPKTIEQYLDEVKRRQGKESIDDLTALDDLPLDPAFSALFASDPKFRNMTVKEYNNYME